VRLASVVPEAITFVGTNNERFELNEIEMVGSNADVVYGTISVADSNEIKKLSNLATATPNTNSLTLSAGAFSDMVATQAVPNGYPNVETTQAISTDADGYVVDEILPKLTSYTLNMASLKLTMTFSDCGS
jgi:hypothetical protein